MKAITIKQPWASLIALGEKQFETRSWQTKHRGPIAIHAGKSVDKESYEYFSNILAAHGIHSLKDLPTGVIVATCDLVECHQIMKDNYENSIAVTHKDEYIDGKEYWFGDYSVGRFAWQLSNLQVLPVPVPAKGQLSLWNWDESKVGEQK